MSGPLTRVDHIDLKTPDLAATRAYFEALGLDVVRDTGSSIEMALPGAGQVVFEIREDASLAQLTVDHVAFGIAGPEALDELKTRGISFDRERATVARTGRIVSNFRDPNGGKWQLAEDPVDVAPAD